MLRVIDELMTRPCWRRSSGTRPTPRAMARRRRAAPEPARRRRHGPGVVASRCRRSRARPRCGRPRRDRRARRSRRPAPRRDVDEDAFAGEALDLEHGLAERPAAVARARAGRGRPSRERGRRPASPASSRDSTSRPSRRTVTRWQSANTSSSRCEMNSTATPRLRTAPRPRETGASTSTADSAAVGSSITITLASSESAFAISTSCCSAIERPRAMRPGSSRNAEPLEDRLGLRGSSRARSIAGPEPSGWRPMKMFSSNREVGEERRLLVDDRDPGVARRRRSAEHDLDAVDEQLPGVGRVHAGEDLHERRLARAVLADQSVRLAGVEVDRDVLERAGSRRSAWSRAGATGRGAARVVSDMTGSTRGSRQMPRRGGTGPVGPRPTARGARAMPSRS